jgi:hypothetical protein
MYHIKCCVVGSYTVNIDKYLDYMYFCVELFTVDLLISLINYKKVAAKLCQPLLVCCSGCFQSVKFSVLTKVL